MCSITGCRTGARATPRAPPTATGSSAAVVEAILAFEPRLKQPRVQLEPEPDAPWRLRLRIMGTLEVGAGPWAVAFVAQLADGHPVGVVDERIA